MITPSVLTVAQGGSGSVLVTTVIVGSGSPQNIVLSASGLPSNTTGIFSSSTIQSGQSSTLTITAANSATPGTSTVTVTATGSLTTHTNTFQVTIVGSDFTL
jgi:hypothetical protein